MAEHRSNCDSACVPACKSIMRRAVSLGSKRVWYVLLFNAFLHFIAWYVSLPLAGNMTKYTFLRYGLACFQGVTFLAYPFVGWAAELLSKYRVLKLSMVIIMVICLIVTVIAAVQAFTGAILAHNGMVEAVGIAVLVLSMVGFGTFDANALRFGTDQLPDSSSEQLSSYVHWYYWTTQIGPFSISCFCDVTIIFVCHFQEFCRATKVFYVLIAIAALIQLGMTGIALAGFCVMKRSLELHRRFGNPLTTVYKVVQYAWRHKVPENRSAFTYWEEDIPSRIDLGKHKYGGPFTNEEVEGVKAFFRIALLLLTLNGFQLAGDTFSVSEHIKQYGCPSPAVIIILGLNPFQVAFLIAILSIPLCQLCSLQQGPLSMLRKMGIGLFCSLLQEVSSTVIGMFAEVRIGSSTIKLNNSIIPSGLIHDNGELTLLGCYAVQTTNSSLLLASHSVDSFYLWLAFPQVLNGFSQLLVFMTALEFICAQAPYSLQGLLIGLLYATYFTSFFIIGLLDTAIKETRSWLLYHNIKIAFILVFLLLYCWVALSYQYRERNEVVNERWMIEQICERNIDRREEYERNEEENEQSIVSLVGEQRSYGAV